MNESPPANAFSEPFDCRSQPFGKIGVLLVNLGTPTTPTTGRCGAISRSFYPIAG